MNSLFISSVSVAATSLISAILIPCFGHKKIHWLWSIFNLIVAFWGFGLLGTSLSNNSITATFWLKFLQASGGLAPIAYCHFSAEFAGLNKNNFIKVSYFLGAAMSLLVIIGAIHTKTEYIRNSFYYVRATDWTYFIITIYFLIYTLYGGSLLWKSLKTTNEENKTQAKILIISTFIGFLSGTASHFFTVHRIFDYPEINIFVTIYILLPTYAIFRYKLFGLEFVLRKSLVYTLLISIITTIYFLVLILIEKNFQKNFGYNSLFFTLVVFSFIIILAEPLRIKIQIIVDQLFFKGSFIKIVEERDRLNIQMMQQDRLKAVATLAAGMAHEIKNPLTAIKTFTEHLPSKSSDAIFIDQFTKIVGSEVLKIDTIVKQLLEFSKPTPPKFERIDITQIFCDTLNLLKAECMKYKIEVIKTITPDILWVNGDKQQLQQAFLNLLLNAIQAMPSGGMLEIGVGLDSSGAPYVSISDTGVGISKENMSHIFDPFFTTKESGTGLGLAICHGILKKHNCSINLTSQLGKGTTFQILFRKFVS